MYWLADQFTMAEFNADFQNLKPYFSETNPQMEMLNNLSSLENLNPDVQQLVALSSGSCFLDHHHHQPLVPMILNDKIENSFSSEGPFYDPIVPHFLPSAGGTSSGSRRVIGITETDALAISSPDLISGSGRLVGDDMAERNYGFGGKQRKRSKEGKVQKPREVVHVRAKRGQATDSHSLGERMRREKINEKLRRLQDLVPGCCKTMGMAVMLDVITSYIRSLQSQIEFLSMKLSAASEFNSEMDARETLQGTTGYEAQGMERRVVGEGYGEGFSNYFPSTWPHH